jgi:hypothetical protein
MAKRGRKSQAEIQASVTSHLKTENKLSGELLNFQINLIETQMQTKQLPKKAVSTYFNVYGDERRFPLTCIGIEEDILNPDEKTKIKIAEAIFGEGNVKQILPAGYFHKKSFFAIARNPEIGGKIVDQLLFVNELDEENYFAFKKECYVVETFN